MNIKIKLIFFSHNKLKIQPRSWKTFMFNINSSFLLYLVINRSIQC